MDSQSKLNELREDPKNQRLFEEVKLAFSTTGDQASVAEAIKIYATAAPQSEKNKALLFEAAAILVKIGETSGAEELYHFILTNDTRVDDALYSLIALLQKQNRFARCAEILSWRIDNLQGRPENKDRLLRLHQSAAKIFGEKLARLDKAADHWLAVSKLNPEDQKSLSEARRIYASVGDTEMIAKLLEEEIERSKGDRQRTSRAELECELGLLKLKNGKEAEALVHLESGVRLDPGNEELNEKLAVALLENVTGDSDMIERGEKLLLKLAEKKIAEGDARVALEWAEKVLEGDGGNTKALDIKVASFEKREEWAKVAEILAERAAHAGEETKNAELEKIADLFQKSENWREEKKVRKRIAETPGADFEKVERYKNRLIDNRDFVELSQFMEAHVARGASDLEKGGRMLELARINREHLGNKKRAAQLLHQVLQFDPDSEEARLLYAEHFKERRDWKGLVNLLEFAYDSAKANGESNEHLVELLEEIANSSEKKLGDFERALGAWRRMQTLAPDDAKAKAAIKRLSARAEMWQSLCGVLEKEAAIAETDEKKLVALNRIASTYKERHASIAQTIGVYQQILELKPNSIPTLNILLGLYERDGDDLGVARTIQQIIQIEDQEAEIQSAVTGQQFASVREWPVAKRVERLSTLRRLARLFDEQINDQEETLKVCNEILEVIPGDREALERMEKSLERSGDTDGLIKILSVHSKTASTPAERAAVLRRLAHLVEDCDGAMEAAPYWQELLEVAPNDIEAIDSLIPVWRSMKRFDELVNLLTRKTTILARKKEELAPEEQWELANLFDTKLDNSKKAAETWAAIGRNEDASIDSRISALVAEQRTLRDAKVFDSLEESLALSSKLLLKNEDKVRASEALCELADVQYRNLGSPEKASATLTKLLALADPTHGGAHQLLREIYEAQKSFDKAVRIAEKQVLLSSNAEEKQSLLLAVGKLCTEKLNDSERAATAYQRLYELNQSEENASEYCRLLRETKKWDEYVRISTKRIEAMESLEAGELCNEVAAVAKNEMNAPDLAIDFYKQSFLHTKDPNAMDRAHAVAENHGTWKTLESALVEVNHSIDGMDPSKRNRQLQLQFGGVLARVRELNLSDTEGAVSALASVAEKIGPDEQVLKELLRLGRKADRPAIWKLVATTLRTSVSGKYHCDSSLILALTSVLDEQLATPKEALEVALLAFSWEPNSKEVQERIYELAGKSGQWAEVVAMESALAISATEPSERVEHLSKRADILENKLGASVRAFRSLLSAYLIDRTNSKVSDEIWRLATLLGNYESQDKTPAKEPKPASIVAIARPAFESLRREPTLEISMDEMQEQGGISPPALPIDTDELEVLDFDDFVEPPALPRTSSPLPGVPRKSYDSPWEEYVTAILMIGKTDSDKFVQLELAARVWEEGGKNAEKSILLLAEALSVPKQDNRDIRKKIKELAAEYDKHALAIDVFLSASKNAPSRQVAVSYLVDVAEFNDMVGDGDEVERVCRRILGIDPASEFALTKLETLYRDQQRWVDLAALLEERTDPRLGGNGSGEETSRLLAELAALYEEKLDRPADAVEVIKRSIQLAPQDADAYMRMADIYRAKGSWHEAIRTLRTVSDLSPTAEESIAALREAANIYDEKLGMPEKAISLNVEISTMWPNDPQASSELVNLYSKHEKWNELSILLRRLAGQARDKEERIRLLKKRAEVLLHRLNDPAEACAALKHAQSLKPDELETLHLLADALCAAKKTREAISVIQKLISAQRTASSSPAEIAKQLVRVGTLRAAELDDAVGAEKDFRSALELVPNLPAALSGIAKLAKGDDDQRVFADAKVKEAEVLTDVDKKIDAYRQAAIAYRDNVGDVAKSRECFKKILELRPFDAEATWGMAGLFDDDGDQIEAIRMLQQQLDSGDLKPGQRKNTHLRLASLAQQTEIPEVAEQHLLRCLELEPEDAESLFALVDLKFSSKAYEEAEAILIDATTSSNKDNPQMAAEVYRRLAEAQTHNGKQEDAYRSLLAAEKLDRKNLLVRVALGHNRFKSRRWREASLHLSSVSDHKDASKYPFESANALWHAAIAEVRSLRPDRSEPLYRRALEIKPDFGPALHSLAEIAMEQGDFRGAIDLLDREAAAVERGEDKAKAFEALGDLVMYKLNDSKRAQGYYQEALAASDDFEVGLLDKLLEGYVEHKNVLGQADVLKLKAAFSEQSSQLYLEATEKFAEAGSHEQSMECAKLAVAADPYNVRALRWFADYSMANGDFEAVRSAVGKVFGSGRDALSKVTPEERAELHVVLGAARLKRGDEGGATTSFDSALRESPDGNASHEAKSLLLTIESWCKKQKPEKLLRMRREVAASEVNQESILTLSKHHRENGDHDLALSALQFAEALGHELTVHESEYVLSHNQWRPEPKAGYLGSIGGVWMDRAINTDEDLGLESIMEALWSGQLLWPDPNESIKQAGRDGDIERLTKKTGGDALALLPKIREALGAPNSLAYVSKNVDAPLFEILIATTPVIIFAPRALVVTDEVSEDQLRYNLGRVVELTRPERVIAAGQPIQHFQRLLSAVVLAFGNRKQKEWVKKWGDHRAASFIGESIVTDLPMKARTGIANIIKMVELNLIDPRAYIAKCHLVAAQAGLVLTPNPHEALKAAGEEHRRGLVAFGLSGEYTSARRALGFSIEKKKD